MRRNGRRLRGDLERGVSAALARGSVVALVAMAFFAVIREGFESAVFLLAAFDASSSPVAAGGGALLGFAVAILLGWGIYRGGVRIDLARFFRVTGVVLVLVAAGLLASAAHSAHEAAWVTSLQGQALDLTWLVDPGSIRSALLTGMFGPAAAPDTARGARLRRVPRPDARLRAVARATAVAGEARAGRVGRTGRMRRAAWLMSAAGLTVAASGLRLGFDVQRHEGVLASRGRRADHGRRV